MSCKLIASIGSVEPRCGGVGVGVLLVGKLFKFPAKFNSTPRHSGFAVARLGIGGGKHCLLAE